MRKNIEVLVFVAAWMSIGWIFHLDANAYLLVGVPLVVLFQKLVAREPLTKLWVIAAPRFRLRWVGVVASALLLIAPAFEFVGTVFSRQPVVISLWFFCAMSGAVFAAFALQHQCASDARRGLISFTTAVLIGLTLFAASAVANHRSLGFSSSHAFFLLTQFLLYFAVCFVLEEVAFRGALDSHLHKIGAAGRSNFSKWSSAIFISALWGIWHLPTLSLPNTNAYIAAIPALIIVHTLVGVPLSLCWRASGTLVLPAAAHALIDAYRNTIAF